MSLFSAYIPFLSFRSILTIFMSFSHLLGIFCIGLIFVKKGGGRRFWFSTAWFLAVGEEDDEDEDESDEDDDD